MPVLRKSNLQLKTDLAALSDVLGWFNELHQPSIAREIWLRCQLALAEAFTNAVRHAHKDRSKEVPIDLEVTISEDAIEMRIWDFGPPFDLKEKLRKMPRNQENESGGGRGLRLLEAIADSISYTRIDNRNCLLMVKNYGEDKGLSQ